MLESRLACPHYLRFLDHEKASPHDHANLAYPNPWGIELRGKHRGLCVRKIRYTLLRNSREHSK